ncbi:MAG: glycine cleavage system aminomethyltransferase GcvT [Planctomycetaceae bacterium]|nr:glycine cleavage system aminomethyltransferase GcvT [Planctomycetaceae bacterium]
MLTTAFHSWHVAHGARLVDFAGWHMPIQYTTITEEHHAVRRRVGLFDIAHMGRLRFSGPDAARLLDRLLTNDVAGLKLGQVRYALVCRDDGGILDDVLVYRFEASYLLVVNASNRIKILDWIAQQRAGFDAVVTDLTLDQPMVAVQGPGAIGVVESVLEQPVSGMKYYTAVESVYDGQPAIISRTGYTGEDGFELIVPTAVAVPLWERLMASSAAEVTACGLGCRDTLRLEAAMPLYGHELDESIDPLTAGLDFAVKLQKGDFHGRAALQQRAASAPAKRRVGLQLAGRRIAREGALIHNGNSQIGRVTSGTFSPTLERPIAMAYVDAGSSAVGTPLSVDIRGQLEQAEVVPLPFYRRPKTA